MKSSTDLHKTEPVGLRDDSVEDVAWLDGELADAGAGSESDLMRLLLSRVTLDHMFQFCALLDAGGTMWDVNNAALRGAGLTRRDIHGRPFWEARWWQSSPEASQRLQEAIARAAQGEFVRYDVEVIGRAGGQEIITIDFNIQPVQDRAGAVRFLICEGRDVTEQRHLEREMARQREEVAKLDELKTQLFANVSHEFRTPLTLMLGHLEDALADPTEPLGSRQRERTIMIQRNGLHLQRLVNALLDFSRVAAGKIVPSAPAGEEAEVEGPRMGAIAVQAGIAIDNARLYRAAQDEIERRKGVEAALRESEETLESRVAERTAELAASNALLLAEAEEREHAEGRFGLLVKGVVDYAIYMLDPTGVITSWNTGAERIKGYSHDEIVGRHFSCFFTEEDRAADLPARALGIAAREGKYESEGWRVRKNGSPFWASVVLDAIRDKNGVLLGYAKITRDITERREITLALQRTQEQLAQAQKMEGIGHLTGGVAHDFNNLLAIIMGNLETLQRVLNNPKPDKDRLMRSTEHAMRGAQRAAALTQRLLAFSRQQPLDPKIVEVGKLVAGMSELMRRTIGEDVDIETVLFGGLWRVHVDPNQLEVAILNLAVNARDAMPEGGKLTIETANVYLDETYAASQAEVLPGQYVVISVTDTGCGMTPDVVARVFEPFFTTKDIGHGTGLGLSQVYGFVKQSGGHVKIYSEVGEGTTVKIYLPRLHAAEAENAASEPGTPLIGTDASETILVVEDDGDVRASTREMLSDLGYRTLEAGTGQAALEVLQAHPEIRLLFTDVGLPGGINGRQLADVARGQRSDLLVLFTTGYARNAIVHHGRLDPGVHLITKPYTYAALASKLRDILDAHFGSGRVLLVEDEPLIQVVAAAQLEELGFKVEIAGSATEAMNRLKLVDGDVEVAIIDVGLPDRKGDVLVAELRTIYPFLPLVIASGYGEMLRDHFAGDERIALLSKPYTGEQLTTVLASLNVLRKH